MPRATNAPASRLRRKRILKRASGFYGARSKLIRTASEAVERANVLSTFHRKARKGEFRALWITRLAAACKLNQISYSRFIEGLTKAGVAGLSDATLDAALSLGTRAAAVTVSRAGANPPWAHEL